MKAVFFIVHLVLATLAAWQGYMIFFPDQVHRPSPAVADQNPAVSSRPLAESPHRPGVPGIKGQAVVVQRNLFKVAVDKDRPGGAASPGTPTAESRPEKTTLKLVLWGTVAGKNQKANWAVIENKKTRTQDLYRTGDRIMGAEIKKITRNRVILTLDGKDQMLEAETKSSPDRVSKVPGTKAGPAPGAPNITGTGDASPGAALGRLRSRPYMKDGTPQGLLIYGIRPGSPLLAMGLRNGDIVQTVNDIEINTPKDLKELARELDPDFEIKITLSRRGQEKEIFYKGADE
ncbi:MAG: PDZ domain-containing protein [Desulfobacter sp.]|nr:MAG: PDZ domain-containing protein [Desulfobacter sp.]